MTIVGRYILLGRQMHESNKKSGITNVSWKFNDAIVVLQYYNVPL